TSRKVHVEPIDQAGVGGIGSIPSFKGSGKQIYPEPVTIRVKSHSQIAAESSGASQGPLKSNQLRALTRKAISYQKRQMFTNICCVCCCPLMMVIISSVLGTVLGKLIQQSYTVENIQYCSNNNSLTSYGFPYFNTSDSRIYGYGTQNGKSVNFMYYSDQVLSYTVTQTSHACVYWFGENYPQDSAIYEKNAALTGLSKLDTTYMSPPDNGWVGSLITLYQASPTVPSTDFITAQSLLSTYQTNQWFLAASGVGLSTCLGARPALAALTYTGAQTVGTAASSTPFVSYSTSADSNGYSGMLGSIEGRLYLNLSSATTLTAMTFNRVPYAQLSSSSVDNDLDDSLSSLMSSVIAGLAGLDKSVLLKTNPTALELANFYKSAQLVTQNMPYGAVYLNTFDQTNLYAQWILHFGTDVRIEGAGNFPSQGQRQLTMVAQLGQVSLRALLSSTYSGATITQGIRAFPQTTSTLLDVPIGGLIGRILYPFGVSFLLPIFTIMLVKEKEDRIFIMMKLNGLKAWTYYLSHYATFYVLYLFSTATGVLVLLFFIWGHNQIILAFFFSTLFSRSRIALVLVFLIVLVGVIISLVAEQLFAKTTAPMAYFLWPPFAFYRALTLINRASYTNSQVPYKISVLKAGNEAYAAISFLIAEIFFYGLLTAYLTFVIPSEFGTTLPWHFPITMPYLAWQKSQRRKLNNGIDPLSESQLAQTLVIDEHETRFEDADVKAEKIRVEQGEYPRDCPLVISHMRKVYASRKGLGPKYAVKDVSFPNGAGKTTLMSILTGIYPASFGNALLAGFDIKADASEICKVMGICPQFDILWEELTIEEHLYFYARLKGICSTSFELCSLSSLAQRQTKRLSGGEKRRLSIAIALIGKPKIVFLDEPTTGLDPQVRRLIWNIIHEAREDKAVVLTTHSMEEAEALCNRIGIMAKGTLRCLAPALRLKELYGSGFRVYFNTEVDDMKRACEWVESLLPSGFKQIDAFSTMASYEFPSVKNAISSIFEKMEAGKTQNGILDWGISQTSLEDVFVKIISEDDANAD
ncbi:hypothetical protein BCR33DRAFT_725456, partial [Rhizoclosmatium globosum]